MQLNLLSDDLFPRERATASAFLDLCSNLGVDHDGYWSDRFGTALRRWSDGAIKKPIRTLSLFSGAGGLDIGFHDAGFHVIRAVEIDERFAKTLNKNSEPGGYLQGTEVTCKDVREFRMSADDEIDFIIGGPPCQTFSAAGRRAAGVLGTQDQRGTLFEEYVRLLKELKPEGFLFENVYGITGAEGGRAWQQIQAAFQEAGYNIYSRIIDAADYGVAQHRERLIIVGSKTRPFAFPKPTHGPDSLGRLDFVAAKTAIDTAYPPAPEPEGPLGGRYGHLLAEVPPGLNYSFFTEEFGHPQPIFAWRSKFSDFLYKADPNVPVRTIKAQGGQYTGPFHWESRAFTIAEMKRLQSFPDSYQIAGGRQAAMHQIGNSVPPQLARIMAAAVLNDLFGVQLPIALPRLHEDEVLGFRRRKRALSERYRKIAVAAIAKLDPEAARTDSQRTYHADLDAAFGWHEQKLGKLLVEVKTCADLWEIHVQQGQASQVSNEPAFEIMLHSASRRPWALGATCVRLVGSILEKDTFLAAWKAFEAELIKHSVKADLVQLCEYYQYKPRFQGKMKVLSATDWTWSALTKVVAGLGTREILPRDELAKLLDVSPTQCDTFASYLRLCGYEVRNSFTNPQIEEGHYLIPYAFPTLNPQSVQLRKTLANPARIEDEQ